MSATFGNGHEFLWICHSMSSARDNLPLADDAVVAYYNSKYPEEPGVADMLHDNTKRREFSANHPLVRRFGIRGFKIYLGGWFGFLFTLLIIISSNVLLAFARIAPGDANSESHWAVIIYLAVSLIVAAAALLTRMLLSSWREIQSLQSRMEKG